MTFNPASNDTRFHPYSVNLTCCSIITTIYRRDSVSPGKVLLSLFSDSLASTHLQITVASRMSQPLPNSPIFTPSDIRALVRGPSDDERAAVAFKLCRKIDTDLSRSDRAAANEILRVMAGDAAELVRRALAVTLRASEVLPRDVALRLADDVESIATPVLAFSPVFSDGDLAEIVRRAGPARQLAVASRSALSETVTDAIAEFGCEDAVARAADNAGASFSEHGLVVSLDRFRESRKVTTAVAYRRVLPPAVTEKLMALVTDYVRDALQARHGLSPAQAAGLASGAHERATLDVLDEIAAAPDMAEFVRHLHRANRLTSSLLLRAATSGYMTFVEHGLAVLSAVPHHRAWLLIHDAGGLGFKALYERAGLPQRLFPTFRIALETFHAMGVDGKAMDPASFQTSLLERFLTQAHGAPREDLDYLLDRLDLLEHRRQTGRRASLGGARA
jgi:uncharacterized protein (DUF2336 family)